MVLSNKINQYFRIKDRRKVEIQEKIALKKEGEEIRRLAAEAENLKQKMKEDNLKEKKMTYSDLSEDIENIRKMREADRLKEEVLYHSFLPYQLILIR